MHVFVTGATGFIGSAVVNELIAAGHTVLGLARSDEGAQKLVAAGAEVQRGTIDDLESLKAGAGAADGVIHLAFNHDFSDFEGICKTDRTAIETMGNVLAGSNKPLIITSGTLMLPHGKLGNEETEPDQQNYIAELRGRSETLAKSLASKGVRTAIMRLPPTNHGKGDKGFITMIGGVATQKGVVAYVGDGQNVWPATHRVDTARAYVLALEKTTPGSVYHVVAEEGLKLKDIAEAIGKKIGLPAKGMSMEEAMGHYGPLGHMIGANNLVSSDKVREQLGWKPENIALIADIDENYF